ncbi:MAG: peptide deformylase [Candidatus Moranbacteria bacterium]|nr:peptide deformylase [Candidatus Moranbacteria bacterium]NTW45529.1 peptide deformylase [Candidatus Moranbacteria bacterium]
MLDILTVSNDSEGILRRRAAKVDDPTSDEMRALIPEMIETMREDGVGLAAPQIGRSIRLFVVEVDGRVSVYFNPVIVRYSEERSVTEEGCLSVPGVWKNVSRPEGIRMEYTDINGKRSTIDAGGFLARVLQHEYDHLEGILFTDRADTEPVDDTLKNAYVI